MNVSYANYNVSGVLCGIQPLLLLQLLP